MILSLQSGGAAVGEFPRSPSTRPTPLPSTGRRCPHRPLRTPPFPRTVRYFAALGLALVVVGAVVGVVAVCVAWIGLLELGSVDTRGLVF